MKWVDFYSNQLLQCLSAGTGKNHEKSNEVANNFFMMSKAGSTCFMYRTAMLPTYHDGDDMSDLACHLKHDHRHGDSVCHCS